MGKEFNNIYKQKYTPTSTYYRLKLPKICKNINRIIYIDTDSVILNDLMELYTLNFGGNYILGRLDKYPDELDKLKLYINNYINCGVLLMDLYSLRKYYYVDKFSEYIKLHNTHAYLKNHDQMIINYICHDKIGILKPVYHMWPYKNEEKCMEDNANLRMPYSHTDIIKGFYDPFIIHFPGEFKFRYSLRKISFYKIYYEYIILGIKVRLKLEKMK